MSSALDIVIVFQTAEQKRRMDDYLRWFMTQTETFDFRHLKPAPAYVYHDKSPTVEVVV